VTEIRNAAACTKAAAGAKAAGRPAAARALPIAPAAPKRIGGDRIELARRL